MITMRSRNLMWAIIALVSIIAAIAILTSVLYGDRYNSGFYGPYGMMGGFGFWLMPVVGAIALILVVVFIYFLITAISEGSSYDASMDHQTPMVIARERYARGEISENEYDRIIDNLKIK